MQIPFPMSLYTFHATLHARPPGVMPGPAWSFAGQNLATLAVSSGELASPLPVSFEEAAERLARLERMFVEPDGSFVWVSARTDAQWQVDGNLYDRNGKLLFVDLKGTCPAAEFDRLLTAFGWPAAPVMFQIVQAAVFLDEAEFRKCAQKK